MRPVMWQSARRTRLTALASSVIKNTMPCLCSDTFSLPHPAWHTYIHKSDKKQPVTAYLGTQIWRLIIICHHPSLIKYETAYYIYGKRVSIESEDIPLPLYLDTPTQPSDLSSNTPSGGKSSLVLNAKTLDSVSPGTFLYNSIFAWLVSVSKTQAPCKQGTGCFCPSSYPQQPGQFLTQRR